ncbi:hypothetical protein PAMP_007290 [Pampus punctatissimus]
MWRVGRVGGLPNKRDTPLKPALARRDNISGHRRRLLFNKHYEAFPEEEVEEMHVKATNRVRIHTQTSIKPVHSKSVLRLSSPAFTENPRDKADSPATPANKKLHKVSSGQPAIQTTPVPEQVTPESIITTSMESDTTFSSYDDDDDDDYYSSTSTTSSSLPSPEIFRKENYVETLTFPIEEDLLSHHLHIKNSTLLDVSHAESIRMHPPQDVSTIIDASTILVEKNSELSNHGAIQVERKTHTDPFQSAFKRKTPPKPTIRRPIMCKKKVWFKSPIVAKSFETKPIPVMKSTTRNDSEPVHWSSPAEQIKPHPSTSRADEISMNEDQLHRTLKRPVKSSPERAKFFDFVSEADRDEFFQRERQRCARLKKCHKCFFISSHIC